MTSDVVCIGELLVDMLPGTAPTEYRAIPGGAPANVAVALARLGNRVRMAARVGDDSPGRLLIEHLEQSEVTLDLLVRDRDAPSDVAFVEPEHFGGGFNCYLMGRTGWLTGEVRDALGAPALVHFGSLLGANPAGPELMDQAIAIANQSAMVSLDVNLRPSAWRSSAEMLTQTRRLLRAADIIKATRAEVAALGLSEADLRADSGKVWLITDGPAASRALAGTLEAEQTPEEVIVIDPTGAGDASFAAFLHTFLLRGWRAVRSGGVTPSGDLLARALHAAMFAGTRVVQHPGATAGLPWAQEMVDP